MSFHFYLYYTADNPGPMSHWEKMEARPIGDQDWVKQELSRLYPQIHWQMSSDGGWSGLGDSEPYIDILLHEHEPGKVYFIVLNKAAPSTMRRIMEHFDLNTVLAPETDDLVDPYAYDDTDRHYATKEWSKL
jgi:hypothetical protein